MDDLERTVDPPRNARRALVIALLLVLLGLFLRFRDLDLYRMNVDVGSYLVSAKVRELPRGGTPVDWIRDDVSWLLGEKSWPHCFLHQVTQRHLHRLGASAPVTARGSIALLGGLAAAAAFLFLSVAAPRRRATAIIATGLVAFSPLTVFYSRVVWGEMAATTFWLLYLAVLWLVFERTRPEDSGRMLRLGLAAAGLLLVGFGYQEFLVVYAFAAGAYAFVRPHRERPLRQGSTWTWAISAAPLVILAGAAVLYSNELVREQFSVTDDAGFWTYRQRLLHALFAIHQMHVQIGLLPFLLAPIGAVALFRSDRRLAVFLLVNLVVGPAILVLGFKDAHLVRLYLPSAVMLMFLAAEGLVSLMGLVAGPGTPRRPVAWLLPTAVLGFLFLQTWQTMFGEPDDRFFQHRIHAAANPGVKQGLWAGLVANTLLRLPGLAGPEEPPRGDLRDQATRDRELRLAREVERPIIEWLRRHREGEVVGVLGDMTPLFYLRDAGIPAAPRPLTQPKSAWPTYLICVKRLVPGTGRLEEEDGPYREIVADTLDRLALYGRADR